ncbi:MAG: hypothetical protein Q8K98_01810 [Bacteroidota bacterium]|nr:hypothetical protein [Bacteroidota bacterium]
MKIFCLVLVFQVVSVVGAFTLNHQQDQSKPKSGKPISFQLCIVEETPNERYEIGHKSLWSGKIMYPVTDVMFNETDVESTYVAVQKKGDEKTVFILVIFKKEIQDRFAEFTSAVINKRLGIFIDNQLVSDPMVRAKIEGGLFAIMSNYNEDEARNIVARFNQQKK